MLSGTIRKVKTRTRIWALLQQIAGAR